jgi:RNA polymerase sigma-70 factor, ECF subfamily
VELGLVEAARRGEREAYERLAREAAGRLYPVACRVLRDRDLADDALQRTLVTIWRELPKLREAAKFEAWSQRILLRFCQDELRWRRRLGGRVTELDGFGTTSSSEAGLAQRDELERAFRRLSADHRTVLVLTYYEGLSGTQAAERLGVSPGTVASRLHYALRALRAALEADSRVLTVEVRS